MLNWYDKCVVCLRRSQSMNLWHALDEDMNRILLDVSVSSSIKLGNKRLIAVNWRDTIFQDIVLGTFPNGTQQNISLLDTIRTTNI